MLWSQTLIPTMKESPSDAEIPSHQFMLRAGLIRQLMAGVYTYLPLGLRALKKAEQIVREEMDLAGASELLMPCLHPVSLWERTGRFDDFGSVLISFQVSRRENQTHLALGPTHEEVITDLMASQISSYRQLPLTLYQIQTKFRNEERPRFGVLRTSEFIMKDAYSFDVSIEGLDRSYGAMYEAYGRILHRCGLSFLPVEAESGPIGGDASHEFMVPSDNGEDQVLHCESCGYAANRERAEVGRISHKSDPASEGDLLETVDTPGTKTIDQVCQLLGCTSDQMIKTLIYRADDRTIAVLVRGDHEANESKITRALDAEKLSLAEESTIREVTGAPVGFAGPVGIQCEVIVDQSVGVMKNAVTGANQENAHLRGVNPVRDFAFTQTMDLRFAEAGDLCPRCSGTMDMQQCIEVGHVFKLGTKYSEALDARFLDENEARLPLVMGCYGMGVNRLIAASVETRHDADGILWPLALAPYEVVVLPLNVSDETVWSAANEIYKELKDRGVDVILDDRDARAGFKFKDADLIGFPLRVVIGHRGLKEGLVELKWREDQDSSNVSRTEVVDVVVTELDRVRESLR